MILLLDDHPITMNGVVEILKREKPGEEVIQSSTVEEAMFIVENNPIDTVFVDINLKDDTGFTFIEWLGERDYSIKVLVLTGSSKEGDFLYSKILGVDAYILKDDFIDDIKFAINVVERGKKFYSPSIVDGVDYASGESRKIFDLTKREIEVLNLLSKGFTNSKISEKLYISEGTVKKHISSMLGKLGLSNRLEIVLFAGKYISLINN